MEVRSSDPDLDALAMGLNDSMVMYQCYDINVYTFYTRKQDIKHANQNSCVWINACYEKYKQMDTYYGIIEEIWVLEYGELKVPLFWCKLVRPRVVSMHKEGVTIVDLNNMGYREEPFVWAKDVVQVFYAEDLKNIEGRHIILRGKRKIISVNNTIEEEGNKYQDMPAVRADVDLLLFEEGVEPTYVRVDHDETIIVP
jgi:hypothetical protein